MPTMELVVPNRHNLLRIRNRNLPFFIRQSGTIDSHRPIFDSYFEGKTGITLHFGNKEFGPRGFFWASDLIDWDYENRRITIPSIDDPKGGADQSVDFRFAQAVRESLMQEINRAIRLSPLSTVYFYTSYQFGPEQAEVASIPISMAELEHTHDTIGLTWNKLYQLKAGD